MQEPENTVLYIDGDTLAHAHAPDRNLTPEKATALLAMFSEQIQRYGRSAFSPFRKAARLVTAQRPFYERYNYKPHNGAQEMARRVRQMRRPGKDGTRPDLLWDGIDCKLTLNSHGVCVPFYA